MEEKKWFYRPWVIALAILFFGPLGLFLLWYRPRTKLYLKVLISVVVLILTAWMVHDAVKVYRELLLHFEELADAMQ
ncbi:hypothetical protein ACFL5C_00465 [Candidatus Omnitrophota bacterium]